MVTSNYYVSDHAFFCRAGDFFFVLDVKRDAYICGKQQILTLLRPHVHRLSHAANDLRVMDPLNSQAAEDLLRELTSKNIFTTLPGGSRGFDPPELHTGCKTLTDERLTASRIRSAIQCPYFLTTALRTHKQLKERRLEQILDAIIARKQMHKQANIPFNFRKAKDLVIAFNTLRPWFPRPYLCLFDSFCLLEYLALHRLFPTWVFGIQGEPFEAHCWLQQGDVVLNDRVERVNKLTPIMTV